MVKILVIEDAHTLRKDIIEMLGYEGYDVRGAENGRIGVEMALAFMPDLIICDIMMPELDGYGVLKELQQNPRTRVIPFIFLTAKTERDNVRQGMELGADDYLTKPFTAIELIKTVRARLERRTGYDDLADDRLGDLREAIILALPHELRTPLTGILGFSDILVEDCKQMGVEQIAEMAGYIRQAAMRLYKLTENYLAYAQLEVVLTDQERIDTLRAFNTVSPRSIIEAEAILKAQLYERESDLVLSLDQQAAVNIQEESLKKLVEELADNAFKFSEAGTTVTLRSAVENDHYVLTISDQGRGMTAVQVSDVGALLQFERKWHEQQGSGLGLVIAQRLVQIHAGKLTFTSVPEKGTTLQVRLPLVKVGVMS